MADKSDKVYGNWHEIAKAIELKAIACEKARAARIKSIAVTETHLNVIKQIHKNVDDILLRQHVIMEMLTILIKRDNKGDQVQIKYGSDGNINIATEQFIGGGNHGG